MISNSVIFVPFFCVIDWGILTQFPLFSKNVSELLINVYLKRIKQKVDFRAFFFTHGGFLIWILYNREATSLTFIFSYRHIFVKSSSFCRTWGEHVVYKDCSECQKQFLYTTCSPQNLWFYPGLILEFSCIELVNQWTICRHIVG